MPAGGGRLRSDKLSPMTRNPKDFLTGLVYVAVGGVALVLSRDIPMGTGAKMGPAYFPTILAGLLILIGAISVGRSFIEKGSPVGKVAWKGLFLVVLSTVVFGLLARRAGTAVALPLMIVISAYASVKFSWRGVLLLAAGVTVGCILVCQTGLGVPLPVLGSWFGG